ncbi:hypothetical protein TBLA_0E01150 [Henningerozyma blattae CBS 6284]|uniref:Uncharacterized protein n=1 Tax=Henningerozyma blattae (strain ATCC 34711 / CBS 6284 / DSM 70876 / NBRC 10599 / NRRL Y-10934 / UCD 77-7) TaxID=1071380 RepID=I2H472_HENB6|nr:hypothetical protein TBLA_0E01150 [Tetrapisispora blattae CBS 6284]CCH61174.1 hypothetical protein TBLA_0E01150 [Tetrapisispora blattae CBS 6284]
MSPKRAVERASPGAVDPGLLHNAQLTQPLVYITRALGAFYIYKALQIYTIHWEKKGKRKEKENQTQNIIHKSHTHKMSTLFKIIPNQFLPRRLSFDSKSKQDKHEEKQLPKKKLRKYKYTPHHTKYQLSPRLSFISEYFSDTDLQFSKIKPSNTDTFDYFYNAYDYNPTERNIIKHNNHYLYHTSTHHTSDNSIIADVDDLGIPFLSLNLG